MSKRVAISSNASQNLDIQNLRDKTQGIESGPQGGRLISGKTTALTWDAQGNIVVPNKLQLGNADLQTTLDGKHDLKGYVQKPEFATYQQKVSDDLKGYVQKPEFATYQQKVSDDLKGYQPKGDYVVKPEFVTYQQKVSEDLKGYQPKGSYALAADLAKYQEKGNYALKDELKPLAPLSELAKFALASDLGKVQDSLKNYAPVSELAKFAPASELGKVQDSLKNYAPVSELGKVQESLKNYAPVSELGKVQESLKNYALRSDIPKGQDLSQYALKAEIPKLPDLTPFALKTEIPKLPDLAPFALKTEIPKLPDLAPFALKAEVPDAYDKRFIDTKELTDNLKGYAVAGEVKALQSSIDTISKVNLTELSDKVKSLDLSQYAKKDEIPKSVQQSNDFQKGLTIGADGQITYGWDSDGATIGLKNYGNNRKDLAIIWADDEDDRLRFIHRHHKDGEREMAFMDRTATTFAQPAYFKGGSSVHNPDNWQTHFPWAGDNKNYIRGDTELRGNLNNIGDVDIGGKLRVGGREITAGAVGAAAAATSATDYSKAVDFVLGKDAAPDRGPVGPARALVRDGSSALTINYDNDFRGGVNINARGGLRVAGDSNFNANVQLGANPLRFSSAWSSFPDDKTNGSEISNDTGTYKKLMIVGNKSAGAERRVGIWDRLDVHGTLGVDGNAFVGDNVIMSGDNSWILHTPNDGRKQLYVAPGKDGGNWDWGKQTQFMPDGNIIASGNIDAAGFTVRGRPLAAGAAGPVFNKPDGFDKPAVQIGSNNDAKDTNIYSLSFGQAEGGTFTGMGLVPNDKKAFPDTRGPVLGTHIKRENEYGIFSDGWDKLFAVQGGSGNVNIKGATNTNRLNVRGNGALQFGNGFDREVNAGQISYGMHDGGQDGTLNIVGAGKNGQPRMVNVWESLRTTQAIGVGDMPRDWTGANFKRRDGRWTHFDWVGDQNNYIRGNTIADDQFQVGGRLLPKYTHSPFTDAGGNDITNLTNSTWWDCKARCDSDGNCRGFNFQNAAWPNGRGQCWIKNNVVNKGNTGDWHLFTKNY